MKVKKAMTRNIGTCKANESLAHAVGIMWQKDCGVVPIVNEENAAIGIITDRDVSVAVAARNRTASEIMIGDVINGKPISCSQEDSVKSALKKMRKHKVKRLPVLEKNGTLVGVITIADLLRLKKKSLKKSLIKTLEAISKPDAILLKEI